MSALAHEGQAPSGPFRIAVLVSGTGSNLRALCQSAAVQQGLVRIVGVWSERPDAPALRFATDTGLWAEAIAFRGGSEREAWNRDLAAAIRRKAPDLIVLAGFMRVLSSGFLRAVEVGIVNVHPSLLPDFPGADAPAQAIRAGVCRSGCSVHWVDEGVDTGTLIAQAAVPVAPGDDVQSLHRRIQTAEHALLPAVIASLAERRTIQSA